MSEQDPHRRLAELIDTHLEQTRQSRRSFARANGLNGNTLGDFLNGKRTAQDQTLRAITEAVGWDWSAVQDMLTLTDASTVTADQLQADDPAAEAMAGDASSLSDAALAWELSTRLQTQAARIAALEAEVEALRAHAPADAYALAADHDRSGVGRHLAEQADATGEEPQV